MKLFKYENNSQKLVPFRVFAGRLAKHVALACCVSAVALLIGIAGYHWVAGLDWVDSLLEASMILGGMGPVNPIETTSAKLFASGYALFSGLVLIGIMGIVLTPVVHRVLHKFHVE
jgi:hypothetical protein